MGNREAGRAGRVGLGGGVDALGHLDREEAIPIAGNDQNRTGDVAMADSVR
jgi:hypothetical protein